MTRYSFCNAEMSTFHGPQLPPNFKKPSKDVDSPREESDLENSNEEVASHAGFFGPALPPNFKKLTAADGPSRNCIDSETKTISAFIGPSLPPGLKKSNCADECREEEDDDDDDNDGYGPVPEGFKAGKRSRVHDLLEIQAREMRQKLAAEKTADSNKIPGRETWMLELPAVSSPFLAGLGPRSFRKKEGPDLSDRSSWTDTPEEKKRKEELGPTAVDNAVDDPKEESRRRATEAKEKLMEEEMRKLKKKRKEKSLLEEHQEKLRKKRKKDENKRKGEPEERRPFSREIDLQVNRFDEAKRKAVIKKAGLLNDRFSSGESKFL